MKVVEVIEAKQVLSAGIWELVAAFEEKVNLKVSSVVIERHEATNIEPNIRRVTIDVKI